MKSEIVEVVGGDESLNYCVKIQGRNTALFRSLEDAKLFLKLFDLSTANDQLAEEIEEQESDTNP